MGNAACGTTKVLHAAVRIPRWPGFALHPSGARPTVAISPPTDGPRTRCLQPGRPPRLTTPANPLIVQGDRTILLEVDNPMYAEARDALAPFAELEKSPEHIHTYRLTPLSLWNAAAAGHDGRRRWSTCCQTYSKFPLPTNLPTDLARAGRPLRPGQARADRRRASCGWSADDRPLLEELARQPKVRDYLGERLDDDQLRRSTPAYRGVLKQALIARRLPGRGPGRLHRGRRAADRPARRSRRRACRSTSATTSARRPTSSTPAATSAAAAA